MNKSKEYNFEIEIIAEETPQVITNCHKCKKQTMFYCSDKFRVNAQQKNIDVWLIYKCAYCDSTWNSPVLSRLHVNKISRELHQKFMSNDRETAWEYAFQIEKLRKLCSRVNTDIKYRVASKQIKPEAGDITIKLISKYKFGLRLDKVLAEILGIPRPKLCQLAESGEILTNPQVSIKSKIKDDLKITIKALELGDTKLK
ncbi:DUF1062 domain-containing protein [Paenibacillus senegalensis]|uniref:DUF1062 domain-containing protein n=1 Tax=Paenibacillus senegalensis TaxID=1465766 RepID=UPI0002899588|nr:DUF1062 domain-containing protein [Paenibacillus senegalensis]